MGSTVSPLSVTQMMASGKWQFTAGLGKNFLAECEFTSQGREEPKYANTFLTCALALLGTPRHYPVAWIDVIVGCGANLRIAEVCIKVVSI